MANVERLVKNTVYMYIRMIIVMLVNIYASRVILDKLGVDDFGIYNAVSSIVAMVTFLSATLSTSSSRYLAFDLGKKDKKQLRRTFSTTLIVHIALAVIILFFMETLGLWYLNNKFVVPDGREMAVMWVYQISLITTVLSIILVPFSAIIIAHEDMNIYASLGVFDVVSKLAVVYLLSCLPFDHLTSYAILLAIIQLILLIIYIYTSYYRYDEVGFSFLLDYNTLKGMLGFTSWTVVANLSNTFQVQGTTVLMNLFFCPAILASKALSAQVTSAIMQFVSNFRTALNPQIIKSYAVGNFEESKRWTLRSSVYVFNLMLIIGLPCIMTMETILDIWLIEVPLKAVELTQWAIFIQILNSLTSSTYIPFVASGKLKLNAIYGLLIGFGYFVVLYVVYKSGGDIMWVQYLLFIVTIIYILIIRPYLLIKELSYNLKEIFGCYWECFKVLFFSMLFSFIFKTIMGDEVWKQGILFILVFIISLCCSFTLMEKRERTRLIEICRSKLCI